MTLENRDALIEIQSKAKVIYWLCEGLTAYLPDLSSRIHTIADLAAELSEDSYELSSNVERNSNE